MEEFQIWNTEGASCCLPNAQTNKSLLHFSMFQLEIHKYSMPWQNLPCLVARRNNFSKGDIRWPEDVILSDYSVIHKLERT